MIRRAYHLGFLLSLLSLALVTGCGGGDPVGANPSLAALVGDWQADRFVVTNKANANQAPELIHDLGAQFTLAVQPSGSYTAILAYQGMGFTEIGDLEISGTEVIFHVSVPAVETNRSRYTLVGGRLTLDGDTEFDFNNDGKGDPATAHIEMKKK